MAVKERAQALFAEPTSVDRARVALKERETDRTVEIAEEPDRAGPEALEFAPQLVAERDASLHEVLARTGERPQRFGLVGVGLKDAEAVMIGARQLTQDERVKPVGLAARGAEPRAGGRDLVGVDRQHPQPGIQQPLDQHPIRPLDRYELCVHSLQRAAQPAEPSLVVRERGRQKLLARLIADQHVVLLRRPVNTGVVTHQYSSPVRSFDNAATGRYRCGRS